MPLIFRVLQPHAGRRVIDITPVPWWHRVLRALLGGVALLAAVVAIALLGGLLAVLAAVVVVSLLMMAALRSLRRPAGARAPGPP